MNLIRNFAIIAHVDHGKSTLADRFLELTGVVERGKHEEQLLDRNPISRERGITIKLAPVRMIYKNSKFEYRNSKQYQNSNDQNSKRFENLSLENSNLSLDFARNGELVKPFRASDFGFRASNYEYILNLIDTPGHVDFSYEVDRTLACVEGVILLVDATQGMQAQTISNAYKAIEKNLTIIPAVNKIDLPNADVEGTKKQMVDFLGIKEDEIFEVSAKTGRNVEILLKAVVEKIPPPNNDSGVASAPQNDPLRRSFSEASVILASERSERVQNLVQALIFDSYYDSHRGVIAFVRVFSGNIRKGFKVRLASNKEEFEILETGFFLPELKPAMQLGDGEIGYIVTNLKNIHKVRVGDTVENVKASEGLFLPGYKQVKPLVFASIFPTDTNDYLNLKKALEKLYLNDSSLEFTVIHSKALGTGLRVGFLGLLHADVVRERLEREFNLNLILSPPQINYQYGNNRFSEPWVKVNVVTPQKYLGQVMQLCQNYRGQFITMDNKTQVTLIYEIPMSEMISDFYDKLKNVSSGYASLDWEFLEYREVEADKLTLLLNGDPVDEFSEIVVKKRANEKGQILVKKLRELIPRQQYEIKIQAQYKGKIIASERIAPYRKDVTKKLYGGDRTRKDKLLDKQKEGKKKLKMIGRVEIPKEAFLKLFKTR